MGEIQSVCYTKEVIEFVAVAKEFCDFVESTKQMEKKDYMQRLQKFLPLTYLKGSLLPSIEIEESHMLEDFVSEELYNMLYKDISTLLQEDDDFLEIYDFEMNYTSEPIGTTISEKVCDIYQHLKNFIESYKFGLTEVMEEALWELNSNFENYWGKACVDCLPALHYALYKAHE